MIQTVISKSGYRLFAAVLVMFLVSGTVVLPGKVSAAAPATITANYNESVDYPLIKSKFGVYDTPYVSLQRHQNTINLVQALRPAQFRIETAWGKQCQQHSDLF